jgi:hypothetical protein
LGTVGIVEGTAVEEHGAGSQVKVGKTPRLHVGVAVLGAYPGSQAAAQLLPCGTELVPLPQTPVEAALATVGNEHGVASQVKVSAPPLEHVGFALAVYPVSQFAWQVLPLPTEVIPVPQCAPTTALAMPVGTVHLLLVRWQSKVSSVPAKHAAAVRLGVYNAAQSVAQFDPLLVLAFPPPQGSVPPAPPPLVIVGVGH